MNAADIVSLFIEESIEFLTKLSNDLLELEREPANKDILQNLFRTAHTLKGNSSTAHSTIADTDPDDGSLPYMEKMAVITHDMENLLGAARDKGLLLTPNRIELLFRTLETLEILVSLIQSSSDEDVDVLPLQDELQKTLSQDVHTEHPVVVEVKPIADIPSQFDRYEITFTGDESLKHAFLSLIYVDVQEKYGTDNVIFTPSFDQLILSEPFERIFIHIHSSDSKDNIITFLQGIDNVGIAKRDTGEETVAPVVAVAPAPVESAPAAKVKPKTVEHNLVSNTNIRVPINRIDGVLKHVSSLVTLKNRLTTYSKLLSTEEALLLKDISEEISQTVDDLHDSVMQIRMTPLDQLFNRFPKYVRDTAKEFNKLINFEHIGGDTEIDKSLLDELFDPLMHLIRNSIFHGIEKESDRIAAGKNPVGKLTLSAKHEQSMVVITIEDDGGGINVEAVTRKAIESGIITEEKAKASTHHDLINLIFAAGLSTAKEVNSVAGRGVGMDAVKSKISEMKGSIQIFSESGKGTRTVIRLPLTLAIVQAMLAKVGGEMYAFPLSSVEIVETIDTRHLRYVASQEVYVLRDKEIPILRLNEVFGLSERDRSQTHLNIIVLTSGDHTLGVTVDEHIGQDSIVVKNIGKYLGRVPGIAGCNILGDGSISLIVDVNALPYL